MGTKRTFRKNEWFKRRRIELIKEFGGVCEKCKKDHNIIGEPFVFHFAHKVGFRYGFGKSRGRNTRIQEVINNPERFHLFCPPCHLEYDQENPFTEEEIKMQKVLDKEEVPF